MIHLSIGGLHWKKKYSLWFLYLLRIIACTYALCNLCVQCGDACELGYPMGYSWSL